MHSEICSVYPDSLRSLSQDFERAVKHFGRSPVTTLAARIIEGAQGFDLKKLETMDVHFMLKKMGVERDVNRGEKVTHSTLIGKDWADDEQNPLQSGETWNEGRRATLSGVRYGLDNDGHPVNPYHHPGIEGRGVLGQYGPNSAVDNGLVLRTKKDKDGVEKLHAMGIIRKYDNDAPAFSGGFLKFEKNKEQGGYKRDEESVINAKAEELFEEMISGSVELQEPYISRSRLVISERIRFLNKAREEKGEKPLSKEDIDVLSEEIVTEFKLEQVFDLDPQFLERLKEFVGKGRECFAGPVLNDPRSCRGAWIESQLTWSFFDDAEWQKIKGENPVFDYQFEAGDDASGVVLHCLDPKLIETAFASHGPMFAFMAASYLLHSQETGQTLSTDVAQQFEDIADFLEPYRKVNGVRKFTA